MNVDADIGIVGAGPVGLATAILARLRGFSVVVWDPRLGGSIDKACGEGLMPSAVRHLQALGVDLPAGHPFRGVAYNDAADESLRASGSFEVPGRGVRRTELHDSLMARATSLGVRFVPKKIDEFEQDSDSVRVGGRRVRWLVGADGLHSFVRRHAGLELDSTGTRFGVRRHYAIEPWSERVEVYWSEVGEAYVTPVSPNEVGVAMLFEPPARFDELLGDFPLLASRLAGAEQSSEDRGSGPFGAKASASSAGRVFLVGDAAGYVDALTGEGIAIGIVSANELVTCLAEGRPGEYDRQMQRSTRVWRWSTRALLASTRWRIAQKGLITLLREIPSLFDRALAILGRDKVTMGRSSGLNVLENETSGVSDRAA